jgi:superfamily II DNA or RNA helicase
MDIREKIQLEAREAFLSAEQGILQIAMRVGKTRVGWLILQELFQWGFGVPKILILYPDNRIRESWSDEQTKMGNVRFNAEITYSNYDSIHKHISQPWDAVIFDEVHATSDRQKDYMKVLIDDNRYVLGLTGTLSNDSERELTEMGLPVLMKYTIDDAVRDGIIAPYKIFVHMVELDNVVKEQNKKGKWLTEKQRYNNYTYVIEELKENGKDTMFLRLHRNRVLQNSIAKRKKTLKLIQQHEGERVMVFTGLKKISESLGIPYYHSTSKNQETFEQFKRGDINVMAVVNMARLGVTFQGLDTLIINSFVGNEETVSQIIGRCLNKDLNNHAKVGHVHIICSTEVDEIKKLHTALADFDKEEIVWLNKN